MNNSLSHDIQLYSLQSFKILLNHEVNRSRRYITPLTLIHMAVKAQPDLPETQHSAETVVTDILNLQLRKVDIPCQQNGEYLIFLPATDEEGGRNVCERLANLFKTQFETRDGIKFNTTVFIGMACFPAGSALSTEAFLQQASTALQYARAQGIADIVSFSNIP